MYLHFHLLEKDQKYRLSRSYLKYQKLKTVRYYQLLQKNHLILMNRLYLKYRLNQKNQKNRLLRFLRLNQKIQKNRMSLMNRLSLKNRMNH
jgi:hypothetical protein